MRNLKEKSSRILFLTRYGEEGPSSRYRIFNYIPFLEKENFDCIVQPLFTSGYMQNRFSRRMKFCVTTLLDYIRRANAILRETDADLVFLEKEIFPFVPFLIEKQFIPRDIPYICDYDDAWFHVYDENKYCAIRWLLGGKISCIMRHASAVITGSHYLFDWARREQENVYLVPTALDLDRYPNSPQARKGRTHFIIGWIGTETTVAHLHAIGSVLEAFCRENSAKLLVIGPRRESVRMKFADVVPWSQATEVERLQEIDVGIMPLPDTNWARGKCSLKLLQYMGCWKPVVASAVGENINVVEDGNNGFLARTPEDWTSALTRLIRDSIMRERMGVAARRTVEDKYSLAANVHLLVNILRFTAAKAT